MKTLGSQIACEVGTPSPFIRILDVDPEAETEGQIAFKNHSRVSKLHRDLSKDFPIDLYKKT